MMRSMTRMAVAGCMALAAFAAAAVPDLGSSTAVAAPGASPFAGSWSGTLLVSEFGEVVRVGTLDWTISDAGRISGTVRISTTGDNGAVVGHVGEDGDLHLTNLAPSDEPDAGHAGLALEGTAGLEGEDRLVVSATRRSATFITHAAILERK